MAVGAVLAISGSSRQINRKASEPVSDRVIPEPGRHKYIIAVSDNGTGEWVGKTQWIPTYIRFYLEPSTILMTAGDGAKTHR